MDKMKKENNKNLKNLKYLNKKINLEKNLKLYKNSPLPIEDRTLMAFRQQFSRFF